jgi:hypothetical protein
MTKQPKATIKEATPECRSYRDQPEDIYSHTGADANNGLGLKALTTKTK